MLGTQSAQVAAEPGPFALPAADAEVDVVALRKDPAVAAGDDAELEYELAAVARVERRVALERDAVAEVDAGRARGDPVHAIGADHDIGQPIRLLERHPGAVAELRSRFLGLLDEEVIESSPLRH